jgi:hypothetical protein
MSIMHKVADSLQRLLGSDVEAMATGTAVIQRKRKFDPVTLLRTLLLTVLKHPRPRPADFQRTARQVGVDVSKAAITGRFTNQLIVFLRAVLNQAVSHVMMAQPANLTLFREFTSVYIGDSTTVPLPDDYAGEFPGCGGKAGTGRAAMKIQLLWEIASTA